MEKLNDLISVNPDSVIIDKVKNGDTAVFEILIRRHNSVLYKIARGYGFNHQDAEDLMQETHVAAFLALKDFREESSYKTWISRIMVNKCLYKLKYGYHKNERHNLQIDTVEHSDNTNIQVYAEDNVLRREFALLLERSLQNLPLIYRTVFLLREIEGFSVAETSELLRITPINVKVRLNRAKNLLQKQIEQSYSRTELYSFNLIYCDAMVERVFRLIDALNTYEHTSD